VDEDLTEALRSHPDLFGLAIAPAAAVAMLLLSPLSRGEVVAAAWLAACAALYTLVRLALFTTGLDMYACLVRLVSRIASADLLLLALYHFSPQYFAVKTPVDGSRMVSM
jgi:hypothetical protein